MSEAISQRLNRFCGKKSLVVIARKFPGNPRHFGFVVAVGKELLAVYQFHDFYPEGIAVLRISDVTSVTRGKREILFEKILRQESAIAQFDMRLSLDNVHNLLRSLQRENFGCIIECESQELSEEDGYYIGRILSVQHDIVIMRTLSTLCFWNMEPEEIEFNNVTLIQIDAPYLNTMLRYAKPGAEKVSF